MYEDITAKETKSVGNRKLTVYVCISVAILLFVMTLLIGGYMYYGSFRTFVTDFSNATSVTYRKGSVTVTTETETFTLSDENVYFVYNSIVNAGRGRLGQPPERAADVVLHYQFGGKLELWEVKLDDRQSRTDQGLFLRFTNLTGEVYAYDTDRLTLDRLPLSAKDNTGT